MSGDTRDKNIFITTDYSGKTVILKSQTFNDHIINHHPEMSDNKEAIKDSIENPSHVIISNKNPNSHIYVTKSAKSTYPKLDIKTIVNQSSKRGYVKTTFFEKDIQIEKEGQVIYRGKT